MTVVPFSLPSLDGIPVHGQADLPDRPVAGAVVIVPGSGAFNRDYEFGNSGTPRDLLAVDLSLALRERGLAVVRYDKRGVDHPAAPVRPTTAVRRSLTTTALVDDLQTVYEWTRASSGLGARSVVLLAHSEGVSLAARLAERGAPAPDLLLGLAGPAESPLSLIQRQITEEGGPELFEEHRRDALGHADDEPWPSAENVLTSFEWWKNWFVDDVPVARRLQAWACPMQLHFGTADAQVPPSVQVPVVTELLGSRAQVILHEGLGHALGPDPSTGPISPEVVQQLAESAAAACQEPARP